MICADEKSKLSKLAVPEQKVISICDQLNMPLSWWLYQYHKIIDQPAKGEILEELVSKAAQEAGLPNEYKPGKHTVGWDQRIDGHRVSNKSGKLQPNVGGRGKLLKWSNCIEFSGSRTTTCETLEEKLNFLSDDHYDWTLCCARIESEWKRGERIYHMIALPPIDYTAMIWEDIKPKNGSKPNKMHTCTITHPEVYATLTKNMSSQLWSKLRPSMFLYHQKLDISEWG